MNKIVKCPDYVGVTCIDGSCPKALYEAHLEYYDLMPTCENCGFYKGCSDCALLLLVENAILIICCIPAKYSVRCRTGIEVII